MSPVLTALRQRVQEEEQFAAVETITPKQARQILDERNTRNRKMGVGLVKQYADALTKGDWELNGEAIKFAPDGTLLDGQHRLSAIIEANTPMKTWVFYNVPSSTQNTMDAGRKRSAGDALALRGEMYTAMLAAGARSLRSYVETGQLVGSGAYSRYTTQDILRTVDEHQSLRVFAAQAAGNRGAALIGSVSVFIAGKYLMTAADSEAAREFFEKFASGEGLEQGNPVLTLRERLLANKTNSGTKLTALAKSVFLVKAFNAFQAGTTLQYLRWTNKGSKAETVPLVNGCPFNPS